MRSVFIRLSRAGLAALVLAACVAELKPLPALPTGIPADFPVASVDEPDLRASAGFTTELSAEDIESTRRRMLRLVLEAERYPFVRIHAVAATGAAPGPALHVDLTLRGMTRTLEVPLELAVGGGRFRAQGEFDIRQTDFGITPFSVLRGALAVADRLHIVFRMQGSRTGTGG